MKIYLVFFAFIFFGAHCKAQSNLQFNQVLNLEITYNSALTYTIPAGKVWKIEQSTVYISFSQGSSSANNYSMYINNTLLFNKHNSNTFSSTPMWLSEGSHTVKIAFETTSGGPFNFKGSINAIEFNIIP